MTTRTESALSDTAPRAHGGLAPVDALTGVFKTLCRQHAAASASLSRLKANTDPAKRAEQWASVRADLLSHEKGEMAVVYPELRRHAETAALADRHDAEAADLEAAIKAVDAVPAASSEWFEKLEVVVSLVTAHVDEEEHQIFPVAQQALGAPKTLELETKFVANEDKVARTLPPA